MPESANPDLTGGDPGPVAPPAFRRRRLLRWGVPAGVVAVALAVPAAGAVLQAAPEPSLPARTPAQLLADLRTAKVDGLSGTVVQRSELGLPTLPGVTSGHGPDGGSGQDSMTALLSGSHTLRVWYAGQDKARVALMNTLGETDLIMNGQDVWTWASKENKATHLRLPAKASERHQKPRVAPGEKTPRTPQQWADTLLTEVSPSTAVTSTGTSTVAGRPAYELMLKPKDTRSLVGQVRFALDGTTKVPLRAQVYAAGAGTPAFEVGFSQVTFAKPADDNFTFKAPPGVKVTEQKPPAHLTQPKAAKPGQPGAQKPGAQQPDAKRVPPAGGPTVVGTGWTSVFTGKLPANALPGNPSIKQQGTAKDGPAAKRPEGKQGGIDPQRLLNALPKVNGAWGSGHLLTSSLVSALVTDDGRYFVGAVKPELLYAAAAKK